MLYLNLIKNYYIGIQNDFDRKQYVTSIPKDTLSFICITSCN